MVSYDEFGFMEEPVPEEAPAPEHTPIRQEFPTAGSRYLGGSSDGWEYRTEFAGTRLKHSYEMVKQFLEEEGYGDIPLPDTAEQLRRFKYAGKGQLQLFQERGYIHNPIKILFHPDERYPRTLILYLYNEQTEGHLLRFHGIPP